MKLKKIKLVGFKSFVDPTVINFNNNRIAIVGPNGCGKSNIIDAVRWVLGESSAKQLRGEAMADVIFNGTSNRKPVGQAAIVSGALVIPTQARHDRGAAHHIQLLVEAVGEALAIQYRRHDVRCVDQGFDHGTTGLRPCAAAQRLP